MMNEEIKLIEKVVEEVMEVKYYDKRDDMVQFQVISLDGEKIPEDYKLIVSMEQRQLVHGMAPSYFRSTSLTTDNFYGRLYAYYCKKKKGLWGKETLKTLNTLAKAYHKDGLESGTEARTRLKDLIANC